MNVPVLIAVGIMALLFIIFLIIRNQKDKKEVIDQIKNDYPKSKDEEGAADVDNKSQMHWGYFIASIFIASFKSLIIAPLLISSGAW